ncbi:MAG: M23 family metallopeptidase [Nocardioides sp.]
MTTTTPGKRRAVKHSSERAPINPLLRIVPSAPVLMGVAALAVSTGGVVTATQPGLPGGVTEQKVQVVAANAMGGASETASTGRRTSEVSRSSDRGGATDGATDEAEAKAEERNAALEKVDDKANARSKVIEENRWVLPVASYTISASFGQSSGLWSNRHTGLDFNTDSGVAIVAVANGTITSTGSDGAYGNKTVLTLDDGTEIWFCHQSAFAASEGDVVRAGELIGYVGSTGNTTGSHLHLEVRPGGGDPVDPFAALVANGVTP